MYRKKRITSIQEFVKTFNEKPIQNTLCDKFENFKKQYIEKQLEKEKQQKIIDLFNMEEPEYPDEEWIIMQAFKLQLKEQQQKELEYKQKQEQIELDRKQKELDEYNDPENKNAKIMNCGVGQAPYVQYPYDGKLYKIIICYSKKNNSVQLFNTGVLQNIVEEFSKGSTINELVLSTLQFVYDDYWPERDIKRIKEDLLKADGWTSQIGGRESFNKFEFSKHSNCLYMHIYLD